MLQSRLLLCSCLLMLLGSGCSDSKSSGGADGGASDAATSGNAGSGGSGSAGKGGSGSEAGSGGTSGSAGKGGSGGAGTGSTEPSCDGIKGKTPTWKVIDPKLADFEMTSANPLGGFGGVAYGNGTFVVLGRLAGTDSFHWATSSDGAKWTAHEQKLASGKTYTISRAIHFLDGKFTFFGEHDDGSFYVYTSADGESWDLNLVEMGKRALVEEFDFGDGTLVYAGHNGDMRSSSDLKKWDARTDTAAGGFDFMDLAYGNGLWISIGNVAGPWFSSDGKTWTAFDASAMAGGARVEYGNGLWLVQASGQQGPEIHTSKDGKKFTKVTTTGYDTGYQARFAGGHFLTISFPGLHPDFDMLSSDDGKAWTKFGSFPTVEKDAADMSVNVLPGEIAFGQCSYVISGIVQHVPPFGGATYMVTEVPLIVLGTFQ